MDNTHADVLALNADDADTANDSLKTKFTMEITLTDASKVEQGVTIIVDAVSVVKGSAGADKDNTNMGEY